MRRIVKTVTNREEVRSESRLGFSGVIEREYDEMRKVLQGRAAIPEIERKETMITTRKRRLEVDDDDAIVVAVSSLTSSSSCL
jgi:hypothetical protein